MFNFLFLLVIVFFIIVYYFVLPAKIGQKRKEISNNSFPKEWVLFLTENVYLYKKLPSQLKKQLHSYIQIFLAEKEFIGKDGIKITEEMKLIVASQACLLLIENNPNPVEPKRSNYFPYLKYIYIYPDRIAHKNKPYQEEYNILLGQSSVGYKSGKDGSILFSWADVLREANNPQYGDNVVLHEFTHQLDQEFGNATGTPRLSNLEKTLVWQKIFRTEYDNLCDAVSKGKETIIDSYGTQNPIEFFAVATEAFFLKSRLLAVYHPLLYEQLSQYYHLDPVIW